MSNGQFWSVQPGNERKIPYLLGLALIGIVWATFSVSLGADFIWGDDTVNIYNNPRLRGLDAKNLWWIVSDYEYVRRYMPLGWLGWMLNYSLTGPAPWGFHLGNILIHTLVALGIFVLIYRLLSLSRVGAERSSSARWFCAWLGALLWAVHPFRVETVAWASGRIYSQAALFFVASLLAYLKSADEQAPLALRRRYYWGAVAAYAASLITYPIALCGVVSFLVLDFVPLGRLSFSGWTGLWRPRVWLEKAPFALVTALLMGLTVWARLHTQVFQAAPTLDKFGAGHRIMQAFFVWASYLWKTWWPGALAPYYRTLVNFEPADWPLLASLTLVLGLSGFLLWRRRQWPAALGVWIAYLVMLIPMLGLTEHPHFANDRYAYIVAWGWSILAAGAVCAIWTRPRFRTASLAGLAGISLFWSVSSFRQCWRWVDTTTLMEYTLHQLGDHPYRAKLLMGYSFYFLQREEPGKAADIYRRVLDITPEDPNAHCYLADILADEGRHQEAEEQYRKAIHLRAYHRIALQNLGVMLARQDRTQEAAATFKQLLKYFPDDARGHHNLSVLLNQSGQEEEARLHEAEAERLRPAANRAGPKRH